MSDASQTPGQPGPRRLLAVVLALLGCILVAGGAQLLFLGGSPYYAVAGLLVIASAWLSFRGDVCGIRVYGLMLIGTLLWALIEGGYEPWSLQARLVAPAVLGVWVFWPYILRYWRVSSAVFVVLLTSFSVFVWNSNRLRSASEPVRTPAAASADDGEWRHYGNDLGGKRFSPLTQINAANVTTLEKAWTYHTGVKTGLGFEATPLMVGDSLYLCTASNVIIALDPETGKQRWVFDPKTDTPPMAACRGVSYYKVADAAGPCAERIIFGTTDARLMAVDTVSGQLCQDFGNNGTVDLKRGMGEVFRGYYYVSSAPAIVRGKVIIGGWVTDNQYVGEPSGVIRAFDAVTGEFAWAWDMDKPGFHGEPPEGESYSHGTANSWAPISGDDELGLVYLPMGNTTPDYWGALRSEGSEKYSSAVVALDAETGEVRWSFQTVHHDLWDYDIAAQPTLVDVPANGKTVPAVIAATKRGQVFLLDRRNGKPIAPVEQRPVPQGPAAGDFLSPTQPFSSLPAFDDTVLTEASMWGLTPLDQLWCRIKFRKARYEGPMTPPGLRPTVTYPSHFGGIGWGGVAVDPEQHLLIVNWNRLANYTRLIPRNVADAMGVKVTKDGGIHGRGPMPQEGTPFAVDTGMFGSPLGVPCTPPPFGKIAAVDLVTHELVWSRPLGTSADSGPLGLRSGLPLPMGVPNLGGSLITRSGLTFIGATQEKAIRAFETRTGTLIWKTRLPYGASATPMTYISPKSGRQFLVVSAGGSLGLSSGLGDAVVAFALPKSEKL